MNIPKPWSGLQTITHFPGRSRWIFLLLLGILAILYGYPRILTLPPQSVHQWRQCDGLSMTLNYTLEDRPFLQPAMHNLGNEGSGQTISECPLVYYFIGSLWKFTGPQESLFRLCVMLIFFIALFTLFRTFEEHLKDSVLSMLAVLLLFTSPTLVYYANNFLNDIPAFSFALIGLSFFIRFITSARPGQFYRCAIFFALAGLLKISALLSFAAILGLLILEMSGLKLDQQRRIFVHPLRYGLILIGVAGIQLLWYSYAQHYNNQHNAGIFLLGILPVWDMDAAAIQATMDGVRHHLRWDYFRQETQLLLVGMFLTVLIFFRHLPRILLGLMLMVSTGFIVYIILFFNALKDHDYYTINLFILVPITLLAFLTLMKTRFPGVFASATLKVLLLALLIHNADFARRRMEGRYHPQGWENSYFVNNTSAYRDAGPYLDSLGIGRDARVISLSDPSINITLYLMDRKGWTDFNIGGDSLRLQEVVARGADYLFISDTGTYRQAGVKALLQYKVGQYRHIAIYRLRGG